MKRSVVLAALFVVGACAAPAVISDINDSALKVEVNAWTSAAEIERRAREGCAVYDKEPVSISYRCLDTDCIRKELLFACKAPSAGAAARGTQLPLATAGPSWPGGFNGRWVGEGHNDGCGSPWAMEIVVRDGAAKGLLWRGPAEYNFEGLLDGEGKLRNALAAKTPAALGVTGPRFITVNAAFAEETATSDYSMATIGPGNCVVAVTLKRHQA